jgi:hypothetical protein
MKKSQIFWIILLTVIFLLIANLLFNFIYFNNFNKHLRPISEIEKQKAMDILNKTINLEGYQIKIGNIYGPKNMDLVQIKLIKGNLKKDYIIDLKEEKIIKK